MKPEIKKILEDLYKIDPSLKAQEKKLIVILEKIITAKPDSKIDESFVKNLRQELVQKYEEKYQEKQTTDWKENLFNMRKFAYILSGAAICALIILPIVYFNGTNTNFSGLMSSDKEKNTTMFAFLENFEQQKNRAFGNLSGQSANIPERSSTLGMGGSQAVDTKQAPSVGFGGGGLTQDAKIMPPYQSNIKFKYVGGQYDLAGADSMNVLNRQKGDKNRVLAQNFLGSMNFGLMDLSNFNNSKVENITVVQDEDYGYTININFPEGSVNLYQYWPKWSQTMPACQPNGICPEPKRITLSEIPEDKKIIAVADEFVSKFNINTSNYGQPEVNNNWRVYYERTEDKNNYYLPDTFEVVYPLLLDGKEVYEESGYKIGLILSINIREMRVINVANLFTLNFDSSKYEMEKDVKKVTEIAEKGGRSFYRYFAENAKEENVELGDPKLAYMKYWKYENNESKELYVPAMIFPVKNMPASGYFYQTNVVVPLVKEMLEENNPVPPITIFKEQIQK